MATGLLKTSTVKACTPVLHNWVVFIYKVKINAGEKNEQHRHWVSCTASLGSILCTVSSFKIEPTLRVRVGSCVPSPEHYRDSGSQKNSLSHNSQDMNTDLFTFHQVQFHDQSLVKQEIVIPSLFRLQGRTCCGMPLSSVTIPAVCCSSPVTKQHT